MEVGKCPKCGTDMRIVAAVHDPAAVARYLQHIGESAAPPRVAPARAAQILGFDEQAGGDQWPE